MYEVKTLLVTKKSAIIILKALSQYIYHFRLAIFDFLANVVPDLSRGRYSKCDCREIRRRL